MAGFGRIGFACLIVLPGAAFAATPTVIDVGENMLPQSVSDDGTVVVGISIREDKPGVFRWLRGSGLQVIGGVAVGRPDVSADGRTIAGTVATDGLEAAFWTEQQGWVPLSATDLVPALPGWATVSQTISADGRRLAGSTVPPPVDYGWERAFSFNPDTWDDRWAEWQPSAQRRRR